MWHLHWATDIPTAQVGCTVTIYFIYNGLGQGYLCISIRKKLQASECNEEGQVELGRLVRWRGWNVEFSTFHVGGEG